MPDPWALRQLWAQFRHQVRLLVRTPRAITTGVVLPVLLLALSNSEHGQLPPERVAGLAVLGMSMTAWTTHGINLVAARESGVLKRWRATPLPAWCHVSSRILATVVVAVSAAAITVSAAIACFGIDLGIRAALGLAGILLLAAAACSAVATAVTAAVSSVSSAFPVLGLTYLPMVFFSGAFGAGGDPQWVVDICRYLPVTPAVQAATGILTGRPSPGRDLFVLAAWVAAGLLLSLITFRWEPTRTRRRRTAVEDR